MGSTGQLCYVRFEFWSMFPNTLYSVDAQWIAAKKDLMNEGVSHKDMDPTRCILYLHGGEIFLFAS